MRKPNPSRGSGFSDTADVNAKIRHRTSISDLPTPGELSARLYGLITRDRYGATTREPVTTEPPESVRVAPYTAKPALSPAQIRRRRSERKIQTELRRRAER